MGVLRQIDSEQANFWVDRYSTGAAKALATAHDLSFPFPFEGIVGQDYLGGAWYDS